jgi:hypothetical protein
MSNSKFLQVPRDLNPSKKTWMWIGFGTLAAVGAAVYYRSKACDVPRVPRGLQPKTVSTHHPDALTPEQLANMKPGDLVGVAVGIWDAEEPHKLHPEYPVKVVQGKLGFNQDGIEAFSITCPLPQPMRAYTVVGPTLTEKGSQRGYDQYRGYLFPIGKIGLVIEPEYVNEYEWG